MKDELMIKIEHVSKVYRLGQIGGTTLREELQRKKAKLLKKEDPTKKIGAASYVSGEQFRALDDVSFEVKKGERVGIIGHNGAGKSTLLKLLSRVTAPTDGEIGLNGRVASMLEVGTGFNGELTGRENIYMNGAILGMSKKEIADKIEDIIEFSECRQFIDTPVKRYSSGMYVKLAFSVAAHLDSEIMIMDEVLAVGDMTFQKKCLQKMNEISKNEYRTILYVSHNMNTIRELCNRVIVLHQGRIVYDGDVETGIEIYLNVEADYNTFLDYQMIPRLQTSNTKLCILKAEYPDRDAIVFTADEKMNVLLTWMNEDDIDGLCLRIELLLPDRTPIATALANEFYSGSKGQVVSKCFQIDISSLVSGSYTMNYVFYNKNNHGGNVDVERAHGLYFKKEADATGIVWNRKMWGSVCLTAEVYENQGME